MEGSFIETQALLSTTIFVIAGIGALAFGAWATLKKKKFNRAVRLVTEVQEEFYQVLAGLTDDYGLATEGPEFDTAVDKAYFVKNLYMQILEDIENKYNGKKSKGLVRLK